MALNKLSYKKRVCKMLMKLRLGLLWSKIIGLDGRSALRCCPLLKMQILDIDSVGKMPFVPWLPGFGIELNSWNKKITLFCHFLVSFIDSNLLKMCPIDNKKWKFKCTPEPLPFMQTRCLFDYLNISHSVWGDLDWEPFNY